MSEKKLALQKVPVQKENEGVTVVVGAESIHISESSMVYFVDDLLTEYEDMVEAEMDNDFDFAFQIDYFKGKVKNGETKIFTTQKKKNKEKCDFVFSILFFDESKSSEALLSWEETKQWYAHVLSLLGNAQEVFETEERIKKRNKLGEIKDAMWDPKVELEGVED